MKRIYIITVFFFINILLCGQILNITFPQEVDSFSGQVVNIPIICENISNQALTIQIDNFNLFHLSEGSAEYIDFDEVHNRNFPYRINHISPRLVQPGRRELIFLSLTPDNDLLAGKRFFPFVVKDDRDRVLSRGVVEINHIINEEFAVVSLDNFRYIIPDVNTGMSYLLINRGTVPIEFKISDMAQRNDGTFSSRDMILQPSQADTLFIPFAEIHNLVQTEFWISFSINYTLTKILPDELKVENHLIRRVIPLASRTDYPFRWEFYSVPVSISQSFLFDESKFSQRNYIKQYITNIQGNGFIDDFNSPYLNFHFNYRYTDFEFTNDENYYYYFNLRSEHFNLEYGENSYVLDQRDFPKYGMGLELAYFNSGLFLERVFLRELYGERAIHNRTSLGYTWENDSFLFEPEQYVRLNYYQKNNRDSAGRWIYENGTDDDFETYFNRWFVNSEHEKFIFDTQINVLNNLRFSLEVFTSRENDTQEFSPAAFSTGLFFHSRYFKNRFSMNVDKLEIINEIPRRIRYDNDLSLQTERLDLYSNFRYRDEHNRQGKGVSDNYITHNFSANMFLQMGWDIYFRFRMYDTATNLKSAVKFNYEENEYLTGLMLKKTNVEYELMYGLRREKTNDFKPNYDNILNFNVWFSKWDNDLPVSNWYTSNINLFFNSRALFDEDEFNITNQASIFNRWTNTLHQSLGVFYLYDLNEIWKNNLQIFTNFFYTLPWQHQFSLGGSYNVNPSFFEQYRYTIFAEYSIPLDLKLLPKSNKKFMTLTFLDHWQRKPVRGAVFEMDNKYFVSNDAGVVRTNRNDFNPQSFNIVNMPANFTLEPELTTLNNMKGHFATFHFAELGRLNINFRKLTYQRIAPTDIDRYNNVAYYQNTMINLDNHIIETYTQSLEVMLRNVATNTVTYRATINEQGNVSFSGITKGVYEILINDSFTLDDLRLDSVIISIENGDKIERDLELIENYTRFQRFE
ncbi:MAG: hypothetical protein FWG98_11570 [Candidatus Cloacimonetes bacterium]|nr:hypothetical protein [Candidatus Cloacimonadota bacterium]